MNYYQYLNCSETTFSEAVDLLTRLLIQAHTWNENDDSAKVSEYLDSRAYNLLRNLIAKGKLKTKITSRINYDNLDYSEVDEYVNLAKAPPRRTNEIICYASDVFEAVLEEISTADPSEPQLVNEILHFMGRLAPAGAKAAKVDTSEVAKLRQSNVTLNNEKIKWDASISAAAKVGMFYYEKELPKPVTKEEFIKEFEHDFSDLPDTTIEMIYKSLPTEYKNKGGRPKNKKNADGSDLKTVIKAAVHAGSIFDTDIPKTVNDLKQELINEELDLPSDDVLKQIVAAVKGE